MSSEIEKPYAIVEFFDGLALVPVTWLFEEHSKCFYPSYLNQLLINKCIANKDSPDSHWKEYNVTRLFCFAESYERGMEKLKLAEEMSDIESENEKQTRHNRHMSKRNVTEDETDDENIESESRLPPLPRKPATLNQCIYSTPASEKSTERMLVKKLNYISTQPFIPSADTSTLRKPLKMPNNNSSSLPCTPISQRSTVTTPIMDDRNYENSEFQKMVLTKLNTIIRKVNQLEQHIILKKNDDDVISFEQIDKILPVKSKNELKNFDTRLEMEEGFYKKMVSAFKGIGGNDTHHITVNILKKILSNTVGCEFSLKGQKKKAKFMDFKNVYRVILEAIRHNYPTSTELDVQKIIALWLTQCKLRLSREMRE